MDVSHNEIKPQEPKQRNKSHRKEKSNILHPLTILFYEYMLNNIKFLTCASGKSINYFNHLKSGVFFLKISCIKCNFIISLRVLV